jgi:hypothetical protein
VAGQGGLKNKPGCWSMDVSSNFCNAPSAELLSVPVELLCSSL